MAVAGMTASPFLPAVVSRDHRPSLFGVGCILAFVSRSGGSRSLSSARLAVMVPPAREVVKRH